MKEGYVWTDKDGHVIKNDIDPDIVFTKPIKYIGPYYENDLYINVKKIVELDSDVSICKLFIEKKEFIDFLDLLKNKYK